MGAGREFHPEIIGNRIARAIVVYTAYNHRQKTIRRCIVDGLSEEIAKEEAPSVFDTVRDLV